MTCKFKVNLAPKLALWSFTCTTKMNYRDCVTIRGLLQQHSKDREQNKHRIENLGYCNYIYQA